MFQPQYAVEVRNEDTYWLPYSVGCLWAYCMQYDDVASGFYLKDLIFKREDPEKLVARLEDPVVCAFSTYIWNEQYNLHVAKLIKEKYPECIIEFGGPQATEKLTKYDFIDCIIVSEGEEAFLDLLRKVISMEPFERIYRKNRIEDMDFQSPYQLGVFRKIVSDNPDVLWSMTVETNRGCPHRCTYCDWGGMTYQKVKHFGLERITDDINWAARNNVGFIFNADANFGMFKERDLEIAKLFRSAADRGKLEAINVQYSKNSTEVIFEIAQILGDISRGVTLSVQSMNEPTLKSIKRKNMSINKISEQIEKSKKYGVKTYTELILGLPEETLDSWKNGFAQILQCGQHDSIDVWFCQMFGDTDLNSSLSREVHGIKTIKAEDYMSFSKEDHDIKEVIELISETNTMTNDELIEAYLYGWLIIQFHIAGYTQLVAKHFYKNLNVDYRIFYDALFEFIKKDTGVIGQHYKEIEKSVSHYMKTGKILDQGKHGHTLHAGSFAFMFNNKKDIFDILDKVATLLIPIDDDILKLQRAFIFDEDVQYPYYIECEDGKYEVDTEFKEFDKNDPHTVFILRRKGLLKNQLCKV
jgi:putative methyltransferase